jgi:lipopolysaccharide exporter
MASGAIWMVLAVLVQRSVGLVSTLILARVLIPQDFGIVAMAMSFVALLEMLAAFGFDVALIQKQTTERRYWDTVWTLEILLSVCVGIFMVCGSHAVAAFFKEPALINILYALAIGSVAQGFQNIGVVAFRTEMRFDREFRFLLAKKLLGFVVTIPLALIYESYWALVIGQTVSRIGGTALSYWVHPYRPRFALSAFGDLFHFSKWLLAINFISYLKEKSSDWIIGRTAGPAALGAFNVSYELASLPSTELVAPINRAVFPAYAQLAKQGRDVLRTEYLSVIAMIALLAFPAVLGVAATAKLIVPVLLGPNWSQAVPVLTLLAFFGFTNVIQSNAQAAYLALGRADVPAKINATHVAVQVVALLFLAKLYGLIGAAIAFLVTAAIMIPLSLGVILHMLNIPVSMFLARVWRPIMAAGAMYVAVHFYVQFVGAAAGFGAAMHLLAAIAIGAVTYVALILLLWTMAGRPHSAERIALDKAASIASRFLPRRSSAAT